MRRLLLAVVVGAVATSAWAAEEKPRPQKDDETLAEYLDAVEPWQEKPTEQKSEATLAAIAVSQDPAEAKAAAKITADTMAKAQASDALEKQQQMTGGTADASNFASRVNDSLQNFLPFFQGAVDAVSTSDDGKSVTVRLNTFRGASYGELGLSATATEPEPSEALLKLLPDDSRPGQREAIQKGLDDFSDVTVNAVYNYVRKVTPARISEAKRFFGRNARLYEEVFSEYLVPLVVNSSTKNAEVIQKKAGLQDRFAEGERIDNLTGAQLRGTLRSDEYRSLIALQIEERRALKELNDDLGTRIETFSKLVANQPQISLTGSYRERDPLVGPREELSLNLSAEMPSGPNINTLLRSWKSTGDWQKALDEMKANRAQLDAGTQWTASANYKAHGHHRVSYQPTTDGARLIGIDQKGSYETCAKVQFSRRVVRQMRIVDGNEVYPMMHLSGEWVNVSNDPVRQDRLNFTFTYDVPFGNGTSVPISVVYSNKGEFKKEPDQRLSAHFGINLNALVGRLTGRP